MSQIQDEGNGEKSVMTDENSADSIKLSKRMNRHEKIAVVGAGLLMRVIIKGIMWISGRLQKTRFFDTEDKALAWVREEIN